MPVPDGAFDAVVSGMAFHWFPDKPAAVAAMARRVAPGGVVAILASGAGTDQEFQRLLEGIDPPVPPVLDRRRSTASTAPATELAAYMEDAGLEVRRRLGGAPFRRAPPEAYLARIGAVASPPVRRARPAPRPRPTRPGSRPRSRRRRAARLRYTFVKLYGMARRRP